MALFVRDRGGGGRRDGGSEESTKDVVGAKGACLGSIFCLYTDIGKERRGSELPQGSEAEDHEGGKGFGHETGRGKKGVEKKDEAKSFFF